jgi:hypothetical protein
MFHDPAAAHALLVLRHLQQEYFAGAKVDAHKIREEVASLGA